MLLLQWLLLKPSFAIHDHKLLLLIIFGIVFVGLVQYSRLIILYLYKIVIDHMFEFPLLRVDLVFILSEAHCLVARLWPSDALRYDKLKVVSGLPSDGGLVASLSTEWHSLLMHL